MSQPRSIAIAVLGTLALFAGIAGCSLISGAAPLSVADHQFLSIAVTDGGAPRALVAGTRIQLTFGASDLSANAGCNHLGGTYRIEGGKLIFENAGTTLMGCDAPLQEQDAWLMAFLGSKPDIRMVGTELSLEGGGKAIRLQDREVALPDLNLVGPTWTLDSILTGDAVTSAPADATATLVFHEGGTVDVAPGCNHGSTTWSTVGGGIVFGAIGLTKRACGGAAGPLEAQVLKVLQAGAAAPNGAIAATIDADRLSLQIGGLGLVFRGG